MRRVQLRGGDRSPGARRSRSTLSARARAPTKQMGPYPRSSLVAAGAVDYVAEGAAGEIAAEIVVEDGGDLVGGAGARDVGRDDDVVEGPEGVVDGQGLPVEDVEHGPADALVMERGDERVLVYHGAAADFDEPGRRLHFGQLARADQVVRGGREGHGE